MELIINLGLPLLLVVAAYFTGSYLEKRHYSSIVERERQFIDLPVVNFDDADGQFPTNSDFGHARMVTGSVVISVDRFKQLLAGLRNLFGGHVAAYESLLDRARREAVLRMKDSAGDASVIANLRMETTSLSGQSRKGMGTIEVHAYGTALYQHEASPTTS